MCLLTSRSQNILHVASWKTNCDSARLLSYLLQIPEMGSLVNQKDEDGNTPLHLAVLAKQPKVVDVLIEDGRVKLGLSNDEGLTAADLAKRVALLNPDEDSSRRLSLMFDAVTSDQRKHLFIDSELYGYLVRGHMSKVYEYVSNKGVRLEDLEWPEDRSNVLHIAASVDQHLLIGDLLSHGCNELMFKSNDKGDLPVHSAVKAGKLNALKVLCEWGGIPAEVCGCEDKEGNTLLHIAMLNQQCEMAYYLFRQFPQAACCPNKDGICPLFLAVMHWRLNSLVNDMILALGAPQIQRLSKTTKSIVHIAILLGRTAILSDIIKKAPDLLDSFDSKGRRPLSYASHLGRINVVELLLTAYPDLVFKRDKDEDGCFPIHQAAKGGHVDVIQQFPTNAIGLLNGKGQNILHVAAKTGLHAKVVYILTRQPQISLNSTNKDLLTAKDMLDIHLQIPNHEHNLEVDAIYWILDEANVFRSFFKGVRKVEERKEPDDEKGAWKTYDSYWYQSMMNATKTNLLAATLFTTMTFTAGLTPPGGYNQSNPDIGMATLAHRLPFQMFVIFNTAAFYCSLLATIIYIWGISFRGYEAVVRYSLGVGRPVLVGAIIMASLAFMVGVFVALGSCLWLGIVVLAIGFSFFLAYCVYQLPMTGRVFQFQWVVRFIFFLDAHSLVLRLCKKNKGIDFGI